MKYIQFSFYHNVLLFVLWKHYTSKVSCMCIYLLHGILTRNNMKLPMNVVQGTLFSRYIYCRINTLNGPLMDLLLLREEVAFLNIFPCRFILEFGWEHFLDICEKWFRYHSMYVYRVTHEYFSEIPTIPNGGHGM